MAGTRESKVRDPVVTWWKKRGGKHIRLSFRKGVTTGWPDDIFLIPGGRPLFIEFKAPGELPTPIQQHRAGELWELGYDVCWADSTDAARGALTSRVGSPALHAQGAGPSGGPACWRARA